jgi:hypothetical protein
MTNIPSVMSFFPGAMKHVWCDSLAHALICKMCVEIPIHFSVEMRRSTILLEKYFPMSHIHILLFKLILQPLRVVKLLLKHLIFNINCV